MSIPDVHHVGLATTFHGLVHPISTPQNIVHQYRGIKYASIPARFRQSKLCISYPRTRVDCTRYGPICPQLKGRRTLEETLFGLELNEIPDHGPLKQHEFECLNLNITCPGGLTSYSRVPVMVWVHGGGDRGSGSSWVYDGGALVRKSMIIGKPIILVNFNYRLGLFGFAASPQLREDCKAAGEEGVGNYGLRDQRRALEWIHRFISEFGGDPHNVTLFGESTGASDIVYHLISTCNQSKPLFHRAIVQSAIIDTSIPDVASAGWHLSRLMSALRISTTAQLRAIDAEKLLAYGQTMRAVDDGVFFRPGWKSFFMLEDKHHHHHHREKVLRLPANLQPLIIGDCACDSVLWSLPASQWTSAAVVRRLKAVCQSISKASQILGAYDISSSTPESEITERVLELIGDARVAWPMECVAQNTKHERGGRGVWRYVFDQDGPKRGIPHHAVDLMYLFDNVPDAFPSSSSSEFGATEEWACTFTDDEDDVESSLTFSSVTVRSDETEDGSDEEWRSPTVDEWSYSRVRDAIQERWIAFAYGEAPWNEEKVFVFGPEGETGERSAQIFNGRRRVHAWKTALAPLGMEVVQKVGVELSRGPPLGVRVH